MEPEESDGSLVSFTPSGSTLIVRDELEGNALSLDVDSPISIQPALADLFHFPVDDAVSFRAEELTIGPHADVLLHDEQGNVVAQAGEPRTVRGTYYLGITSQLKTYVRLPDVELTIRYEGEQHASPLRVSLASETTVTVGARSTHTLPEATITVPDDPVERMEAFSYLGSAIKEFSAERSWPTLRGHPPRFERGDALDVPDSLSKPDTGITVTVPPNHADLYRVAPLSFYLGATVEPGDTPTLHLPNGFSEPLTARGQALEASVDRIVSSCLVLDALVRQDGYNPVTIYEYDEVGPHLPFAPEELADEPIERQLMEYLEAPSAPVLDAVPGWSTDAVLRPDPADVTLIPSLLDSLARIRVAESPPSPATVRERATSRPSVVSYSHANVPSGGVGLREAAFERRLQQEVPSVDEAVVAIVTDDPERATRLRTHLTHAPLRESPERLKVAVSPTRRELRTLLADEPALLVTDLPGTDGGVSCADGELDLTELPGRGPAAIVLDATTTDRETVSAAVESGSSIALAAPAVTAPDLGIRLLGCILTSQSLADAADLIYDDDDYYLVGVPTAAAVNRRDGAITTYGLRIETVAPDEHAVWFDTSPLPPNGLGSVSRLYEDFSHRVYQLSGSTTKMPVTISTERVVDLLADDEIVVVLNGEVHANEIPASAGLVERSARRALGTKSAGGTKM